MDTIKDRATGIDTPRTEQELREDNREQLAREVDASLEAMRSVYHAAACWMAIKEFLMQSDGPCTLLLEEEERQGDDIVARRKVVTTFPDNIGEDDVDNQLANFVDDLVAAIAVENQAREIERRRAQKRHDRQLDDSLGNPGRMAPLSAREREERDRRDPI